MRSSFTANTGLKLAKSRNARQQAQRRRLAVISLVGGLALASSLFGALTAPQGVREPAARTGPFSYFPTE